MKTHCRQWVCGHCDCLVISLIFRLTTFDVRIRRQKSSKSANRVFYIPLNKGYFGKAIFSRLFSAYLFAQRSVKTHCRQWLCGHCDCLVISLIFRLTTFDVRIRRQKSSKSANRVFYIPLNKGYFGKAIFSRLFSARYHILKKKKKKKTILGLCRCSVDNYSLIPGDLPCQF